MSNQYETMSLATLREIAKEKGMKNISAMRKQELIEALNQTELTPSQESKPAEQNPVAKAVQSEAPSGERRGNQDVRGVTGTRPGSVIKNENPVKTDNAIRNYANPSVAKATSQFASRA